MYKRSNTKMTIFAALFAALVSVGSYIIIPTVAIPITLQSFFVLLAGALLGKKYSIFSMSVYLMAGIVGLPVFAGGFGGVGRIIASPAGGFLVAFVPAVFYYKFYN